MLSPTARTHQRIMTRTIIVSVNTIWIRMLVLLLCVLSHQIGAVILHGDTVDLGDAANVGNVFQHGMGPMMPWSSADLSRVDNAHREYVYIVAHGSLTTVNVSDMLAFDKLGVRILRDVTLRQMETPGNCSSVHLTVCQ